MMLTAQQKSRITSTIQEIKTILEEVAANPNDWDFLKTACEIYNRVAEDAQIAENIKSYWTCLADQAD